MGGINEAAHLAVAKKYGIGHNGGPELDETEDAGIFGYVLGWFNDLCETRQIEGMSGLHQPIPYREMEAWSNLSNQPIAAHEFRLLRALDRIFIREERKARAEKTKSDDAKPKTKGKR